MLSATRICNWCNEEKPLTEEFWYRGKSSLDGFVRQCKDCVRRSKRTRYSKSKRVYKRCCSICRSNEHRIEYHKNQDEKMCRVCGVTKPIPEMCSYKQRSTVSTRVYTYVKNICRECDNERCRQRWSGDLRTRFLYQMANIRNHKKVECSITVDDLLDIFTKQEGLCYYTGRPLVVAKGDSGVSIDRLDPSKGYVLGNIVLTSWIVNNMKRHLTDEEFITICSEIAKKHN